MKRKWIFALFVLVCIGTLLGVATVAAITGYVLDWWSVDGGGGMNSTSGSYSLDGTIGQPDAGSSTSESGQYSLTGGFWNAGMNPPGAQTLTVGKNGTGTGNVTSDPVGIDCGATCAADFDYNSEVILAALADGNSTFMGWSDGGCPGTGTCTLKMDGARSVTATFTKKTYRVYLPLVIK
jgi:hypothetical protein